MFVGISLNTYLRWSDDRQSPGEPYESFRREVEQAEANSAIEALQHVVSESKRNWFAAAWLLERRHGYTPTPPAGEQAPRRLIVTDGDDPSREPALLAEATECVLSSLSSGFDEDSSIGPASGEIVVREPEGD